MLDFIETSSGPVPRITTTPTRRDYWGTAGARLGIIRNRYRVAPGLYAAGSPGPDAAVLVTANYKLSFDALRFCLAGLDVWLLVVDTRGINVWCAAGKGTFSSEEVVYSVKQSHLHEVVAHRQLIVPQLAATGVSAQAVKAGCGFSVRFGPVRAADVSAYLKRGNRCDEHMREVTFSLGERAVLIPVEFYLLAKPLTIVLVLMFFLSGIGPAVFSPVLAIQRGLAVLGGTMAGIAAGTIATPLLLPWLPGRQFWLKGLVPGLLAACLPWGVSSLELGLMERLALSIWIAAVSSYLAMNFTGSTPYTSPSGVEYEMRRGLPVQITGCCCALALWLASPFF